MAEHKLFKALDELDMAIIGMAYRGVVDRAETQDGAQEIHDTVMQTYARLGGVLLLLENRVIPSLSADPAAQHEMIIGARVALMGLAQYADIEKMHAEFPDMPDAH